MADFPSSSGTYALILRLSRPQAVRVGRLGQFDFPMGTYVYVGSARGPGGLRARLSHHLRSSATPHWHLDWLRPYLEVVAVVYRLAKEPLECSWVQKMFQLPGVCAIAPGFGSRDCRSGCPAHLVYWTTPREPWEVGEFLGADGIVIWSEAGRAF